MSVVDGGQQWRGGPVDGEHSGQRISNWREGHREGWRRQGERGWVHLRDVFCLLLSLNWGASWGTWSSL